MPVIWRQRLLLLFIIACFAVPLAAAWLLIGRWQPGSSVQHGELLNPARPLANFRLTTLDDQLLDRSVFAGYWTMIYAVSTTECAAPCRTALYDMRQVRLALGKDMGRVKTLFLLNGSPDAGLRQWLATEHPALTASMADVATQAELSGAFHSPGAIGAWIYLLDPLGNLLMRYPVTVEPRGMLKDLQRLLRLSKIG
ncbi:SCO family protein [Candidatus Contendibacter odensensis]|uniref:Thioredoxin domain-containing protein n=1 Tax=Candidatus Contendobacter odensis Run_B_J11 TaxID=1400861 RepID=A0A7U7J438_9GAMM|nr:hypothetical protein [Candidatus Contendobacter odensis]CDH44966.1 conserved exported hypothetical protein [Candidatus Contendobacter odensis Run_B_J11]